MTRLTPEQMKSISANLRNYERELMKKTGNSLLGIAKHALYIRNDITPVLSETTAAIIPITAGKGKIHGFTEAVLDILTHIGIDAYITKNADVGGFAEAISEQADVLFAADDNFFIAVNIKTQYISDNSICTGKAYIAALDLAVKGIQGKTVFVIGYGTVGQAAMIELLDRRANAVLYDIDEAKISHAKRKFKDRIHIVHSIKEGILYSNLIVDATPVPDIISEDMITETTFIAAPGIPLGLTSNALKKISQNNLIHDSLELGVVTMALDAIFKSDS